MKGKLKSTQGKYLDTLSEVKKRLTLVSRQTEEDRKMFWIVIRLTIMM